MDDDTTQPIIPPPPAPTTDPAPASHPPGLRASQLPADSPPALRSPGGAVPWSLASRLLRTVLVGATGLIPLHRLMGDKAAVLDSALTGLPTWLLQVPRDWSADRASDAIVAELETVTSALAPTEDAMR